MQIIRTAPGCIGGRTPTLNCPTVSLGSSGKCERISPHPQAETAVAWLLSCGLASPSRRDASRVPTQAETMRATAAGRKGRAPALGLRPQIPQPAVWGRLAALLLPASL